MRKRRTIKSIKNSWLVLLIVWDNHGRKMPLNHKVSLYNQCWIYGFPDFMTNLLAIQWNARPLCPKYALFSQPQVSQVVLSFLFFQIVNPSIQNLLVRWKLCYHASLKQTYTTHLPHSHAQRPLPRYTFLSKTCSHGSTSCTAFHDVEEIPKQKDVLVMLTIRRENSESKLGSWLLLEMPYSIIFSSLFNR